MDKAIKKQIVFVLEDDNEVMAAALDPDSDLDKENKEMNKQLIQEHENIIEKVNRGEGVTGNDLDLIRDANEIHLNDEDDINGHHEQAVELDKWLETMMKEVK